MLKALNPDSENTAWLSAYWEDFRKRFLSLLGFQFRNFQPSFALSVLQNKNHQKEATVMDAKELDVHLSKYDVKRLELYSQNMADYHLVMDLLPVLGRLYFLHKLGDVHFSFVQSAILLGLGLQCRIVDDLAKDLDLPATQLLGLFNRIIKRIVQHLNNIAETAIESSMITPQNVNMEPLKQTLEEELTEAAKDFEVKRKKSKNLLLDADLAQYSIKGTEDDWQKALNKKSKGIISLKSNAEKRKLVTEAQESQKTHKGKSKKKKFQIS